MRSHQKIRTAKAQRVHAICPELSRKSAPASQRKSPIRPRSATRCRRPRAPASQTGCLPVWCRCGPAQPKPTCLRRHYVGPTPAHASRSRTSSGFEQNSNCRPIRARTISRRRRRHHGLRRNTPGARTPECRRSPSVPAAKQSPRRTTRDYRRRRDPRLAPVSIHRCAQPRCWQKDRDHRCSHRVMRHRGM